MIKSFAHENSKEFKDSLQYTQQKTGFSARLIEKDYYCSVILSLLYEKSPEIFFKGGTLLNKVHAGFYRLSEDLDFSISISHLAKRSERSKKAAPFKEFVRSIAQKVIGFEVVRPLTGSNESVQYNAELSYVSVLTGLNDRILFEIGLREEVSDRKNQGKAATLAMDPYADTSLLAPIEVRCLSAREAFSEKIRAALSRRTAAIRDFYDIWYALQKGIVSTSDNELRKLVAKKMTLPEPLEIHLETDRRDILLGQIETQLKPVLRDVDFKRFKFEEAWKQVQLIADRVKPYLQES